MDKRRNLKERICAAVLVLALVLTGVLPDVGTLVLAADVQIPEAVFSVYEKYTDENGQLHELPIKGATIIAAGAEGVMTEADGNCSVEKVDVGTLCTVSRSGYKAKTIEIREATNKVELEMESMKLSCGSQLEMKRYENLTANNLVKNEIIDANALSYEWISDNPDVISVSNEGIVTAKQHGSANVTIKRGNKAEAVRVTAKEAVPFDFSINPESGTDQTQVAITVGALPSDATGQVSVYKGTNTTTAIKVADSAGETFTWTETVSEQLQGTVVFVAEYKAGTDDVYLDTRKELTGNYLKSVALSINPSANAGKYTYGTDTSITIANLFTVTGAGSGQTIHYKSENEDVVKVNEDGATLSITGAGTAVISAYVEEGHGYTASSAEYTLTIDAKDVGELSLDKFQWEALDGEGRLTDSKVYNGEKSIRVRGTLEADSSNGLVGTDVITVYTDAELEGTDVKSYDGFVLKKDAIIDAGQNTKYTFTIANANVVPGEDKKFQLSADTAKSGFKDGGVFEITKRAVYVQAQKKADIQRIQYGDDLQSAVAANYEIGLVDGTGKADSTAEQGILEKDKSTIDLSKFAEPRLKTTDDSGNQIVFYVGAYPAYVFPAKKDAAADPSNYTFIADGTNGNYCADLEISQEIAGDDEIAERIEAVYENVYEKDGVKWVNGSSSITFSSKDNKYDEVVVKTDENEAGRNVLEFITFEEGKISEVSAKIYLKNTNDDDTRTTASENSVEDNSLPYTIKVDKVCPTVEFNTLKRWETDLAFRVFRNSKVFFNESVTIYDGNEDKTKEDSGIASEEYAILTYEKAEDISDYDTFVKKLKDAENITWETILNKTIPVISEKAEKNKYYLVVVKAKDNVGNATYAASNGLIYEQTSPSATLTWKDINKKYTEGVAVYGGDAEYAIKISDLEDMNALEAGKANVFSGIERMDVRVTTGGMSVQGKIDAEGKIVNSTFIEGMASTDADIYTYDELTGKSSVSKEGKIVAADCPNPDDVRINVTVTDLAGNEYKIPEQQIKFDITAPEIVSVEFDQNPGGLTSVVDNSYNNRTMTVTYKEHNFKEEWASFKIQEDKNGAAGAEKTYTLKELKEGALDGVSVADATSEGNIQNDTDVHIYKLTFGANDAVKDSVYSINEIRLSDHAQEDAVYGEKMEPFTVDNIKPQVTVALNEKNADPVNKAYYKENCVMTVTYKEHNFYEDGLSFDVTTGSAEGFAESLSINLAQLNALDGITAKEDKKQSSGDTHVYEIIFDGGTSGNQDYKVTPHIKDKAGNAEEITPDESCFTVDKIQPEVEVELNSDQAVNEFYYKGDCIMTVTYTDRNFYEEGLTYDIALEEEEAKSYTPAQLRNKAVDGITIKDETDENQADKDNIHKYVITFDGGKNKDQKYTVTPHIKDKAGNTEKETPAESAFTVDKTAPVLTAQYYYDGDTKKEPATTNEIKRLYTNQKVKAVVTIKERNFMLADGFSAASGQMQVSFNEGGEPMSSSDNALKAMTGTGWKKLDQKDTWEQTFEFDVPERTGDSDFDFKLIYKDLADNAAITVDQSGEKPEAVTEAKTYYLTVDKVAPELEVTYFEEDDKTPLTDADIMNHGTRLYQQKKVHARYEITERNFIREPNVQRTSVFEKEQMAVKYEYSNEVGTPAAYDRDAADAFKWIYEFDKQTAGQTFHFNTEANYTIGMTYRDLAGNEVVYKDHAFTVDWTAPAGEITIPDSEKSAGGIWASGDDKEHDGIFSRLVNIVYNFFTKGRHTTTMTSSDVTAGVEGTYYYIDSSAAGDKEVSPLSEAELNRINGWIPYSNGITVAPNSQAAIYEKIVDRSGNVTYVNAAFGIISDSVNPTVTLTDVSATVNGIHNSDAVVEVRVTDPQVNGVYSGIERVEYAIESRTNVTASETGTVAMTYDNLTRERDQSGLGRIRVNAQKFNSNDVTVRATAYDNAGNSYTTDIPLKIDVTAPVVENIAWDTSNASNGKYYNVTRTATITVRERNFDPSQVRLNITNTDGTMPQISGWSVDSSGTSDNNVSRCTVSFTSDGDYNMNMSCTDRAGWTSNTVTAEEFTIDKTVPTINVTFDNNNAANGKYYKESRTATITVNEHNFNGSEVQTAISSNTAAPGVNGWSGGSDVHSATVPFTADGNYSFTVNYTDLAGNPAQVYNVEEFVVDQTKPEIEIFDIVDKSANNGEVAPGVRYSDTNYDVSGVSITYKGAQHDEKAVDGARSNIPNGESIKMADFEHTAKEDDIYTMRAKVTDLAGNFDEKEVTFSVNRFGSNFRFVDDTTEKFIDDYYNNEEKTLTIEEINVDTLTHRGITNSHDGDIADLEEGTDYTVRESGGEVSWKSYEYTIKKENFEQEGLYNITIDSVDRATNEATNKIKNVDIEFIIDKTAPTVVITGIENEGQYRTNERDITIAATDNAAMKQVEVYVDDNVEEFDAKTIKEQKGELPYTLTSSSDWQEIKAVAVDMAGNITDTSNPEGAGKEEWVSVLITSNVFVQFYRNTPLVIGTIAVLVVLAGGIILILAKKRRKDEETAG